MPEAPFEIVVTEAPTASNAAGSVGGNLAAPRGSAGFSDARSVMTSEAVT
jgi:hypothetical protein